MVKLEYLLPLAALTYTTLASVMSLGSKDFDKIVYKSNKPAFVEFYAPSVSDFKSLSSCSFHILRSSNSKT